MRHGRGYYTAIHVGRYHDYEQIELMAIPSQGKVTQRFNDALVRHRGLAFSVFPRRHAQRLFEEGIKCCFIIEACFKHDI